ncbi:hypothetical protein COS51_00440 [Candidatus Roizmanbacteria bacterium CG03_land_8_20_14_0_80_36_21]|uniref:C2H2-type domain-containing protein n=1 Tax=Candidatus Roizmanbacteria bacterium CG23_combo_of_CG06-09_8_20_14_all_35_49 TaxID=1974863 RepID=A0A2G9Y7Q8_9BACT|nr:MAG: hypothetical protein COX47_00620 [Candidatus Roizmanbacteria bacterium CG23_combo_of_CG06-09_8_20_14_all_35_49]PIV09954.1 MAG: hypothetical protein COS51_00440 [Candidatus Roizmanbacteria bacterium CG03_land_8_20_14_0_80_36_21]PJA53754.1 MAG: hypothetical protein CO166_00690 [Candidatus Roizmanbacteria bacterium CG_4_9_14_3_um_filter_36_11]
MRNYEKMRRQPEQNKEGFKCSHCRRWVSTSEFIGTHHRNHCPSCLWSKHVDLDKAGDRKASCDAGMEPLGITLKQAGFDKYGRSRRGELMLIHHCTNKDCNKISINRIAGDDNPESILRVFEGSQTIDDNLREEITKAGIRLLTESDRKKIKTQLFGKS